MTREQLIERERHLDLLADEVIRLIEWEGDGHWGLDGKRPFGFSGWSGIASSVLEIIGVAPNGEDGAYSDSQLDYGSGLFAVVADHIRRRWAERRPTRNTIEP